MLRPGKPLRGEVVLPGARLETIARWSRHPRRPGRRAHRPCLAASAEQMLILHDRLRPGNTTIGRGFVAFLTRSRWLAPA